MKKILSFSLVLLIITSMVSVVYAKDNSINVRVDNKNVVFSDSAPFIDENSRTLVPLRAIGEAMGLDVDWDGDTKTATFTKVYNLENTPASNDESYVGKETVTFTVGSKQARIGAYFYPTDQVVQGADDENYSSDGWNNITMDTAAIIKDGRTYAPVKYLADTFRVEAKWSGAEKTVDLFSAKALGEVELSMETVASWDNYQGWIYLTSEESKIQSVKTLEILRDETPLTIRALTADEEFAIDSLLPELGIEGKYMTGIVAESQLQNEKSYKYTFKLQITMADGTQERVTYNEYIYYDGGQNGII